MKVSPFVADHEHILERTTTLWEPLRGERVFITGGTGFVGTWMMEAFVTANDALRLGARATILTRDPGSFRDRAPHLAYHPAIELLAGDITQLEPATGTFAFVVHAATERLFAADRSRPLSIVATDLEGTRQILDLAASHGTRRFLFTSSGAIYGPSQPSIARFSEGYCGSPDPTQERAAYGESKRLSEFACTSYARVFGFEAIIARLFAFVGPLLPLHEGYAVGNFVADAMAGRSIAVAGDGTAIRSYLYAADMAIWLWSILLRGKSGCAYNVGSPDAISIRELAETVAATLAPASNVTVASQPNHGSAPSSYVPDTARAQEELGLRAWTPLAQGLRRTYDYYITSQGKTTAP